MLSYLETLHDLQEIFNCIQKSKGFASGFVGESIIVTISPEIHWKIKMTEIVLIGFGNIGQFYQIAIYSVSCFSFLRGLDGGDET